MKRFLSILLAMFMIVGALTVVSFAEPEELDELPEDATPLDYAGYIHDAYFVILAGDFLTVAELTELGIGEPKDMNYFVVAVVDEHDCITEIHTTLGRPEGIKSDVVCPEGGYLIGLNGAKAGYEVLLKAKVGDYVTLYNVDVDSFRDQEGNIALTNAGFTIDRINEESSAEDSGEESVTDTSSEDTPLEESQQEESVAEPSQEESAPEESATISTEETEEPGSTESVVDSDSVESTDPEEEPAEEDSDASSDEDSNLVWIIIIAAVAVVGIGVVVLVLRGKKKQ